MKNNNYQYGFSQTHSCAVYNTQKRQQKARKMFAVLDDYYSEGLERLSLLDIGCSAGIISKALSDKFARVAGIDIDEQAIKHARQNCASDNLAFSVSDGMNLNFADASFDIVICAHVYEHVPDAIKLMSEIYRVLKPEGVCYFAAANRLKFIEMHYKLPLLSIMPKALAHLYLRALKKGNFYYENHLTLHGLRNLVSQFNVSDYTLKIIIDPQKYCATEMIAPESFKQRLAILIVKYAYWLCPTYIWLLRKD
ncbi:MAG: class I SAM-dependent methyltransferase [Candidatus Omnitrophota bacterium]